MDEYWYVYFKIVPTNQQFLADDTNQIINRALNTIADEYQYKITVENEMRYYECVAEISDKRFDMSTDCRNYKMDIEREIIYNNVPVTVNAKKLNEEQFLKKLFEIQIINMVVQNAIINNQ